MTAGESSSNCFLVRRGVPHHQTRNRLKVIKIWSLAPDDCLSPRQTGRLTVSRKITSGLTLYVSAWFKAMHLCTMHQLTN
jgi:hypothetical protein